MKEDFKELREKFPSLYEYENSRHRVLVNLIDIEAFGYVVACIISHATIHNMGDNIKITKDEMLQEYGIDEYTLEEDLGRLSTIKLIDYKEKNDGYIVVISKEIMEQLRSEVAMRRIYPQLLKRINKDTVV